MKEAEALREMQQEYDQKRAEEAAPEVTPEEQQEQARLLAEMEVAILTLIPTPTLLLNLELGSYQGPQSRGSAAAFGRGASAGAADG